MIDTSPDALAPLVAPVPGGKPAAWWITDNPTHLAEARAFEEAERVWRQSAAELAVEAGSSADGIYTHGGFGSKFLSGFELAPGCEPGTGWRVDAKKGLLVPSKRTKADRESGSEDRFQALSRIPTPGLFFTGIDSGFIAEDRFYRTQFYVRDTAVMAFTSGDADAGARLGEFHVKKTWTRVPLSTFHLLQERQATTAA